jgi:cytochrome c oxidase subunit 2
MAMAAALVAIVVASLLFHYASPWWATPLASNWREMDDTLTITLAITGAFFVVINLFIVYTLVRFRHRAGGRAAYQPDNRRLEHWLTGGTTLGIMTR